jgi:hypothetical protein
MNIYLARSYNQPQLSSCSTWNSSAATRADYSSTNVGSIFVDRQNSLYASIPDLNQVQVWTAGSMSPVRNIISGIYVDNGALNSRVDRWTPVGPDAALVMSINSTCSSLFLDFSNYLYWSLSLQHRVMMRSVNDTGIAVATVAGNGSSGSRSFMMCTPQGIFVSLTLSLYVADCENNRVQRFPYGQLEGATVADLNLSCPSAVILDADNRLYISDRNHHRIVRAWPSGFECLFGCSGSSGSTSDHLHGPRALSFDSDGSIFVTGSGNQQIPAVRVGASSTSHALL